MGAAIAKNKVENLIKSQVSVANSSSTGIYSTVSNIANFEIVADNGSTIDIGTLDLSQFVQFNKSVGVSVGQNTTVTQAMQQLAEQQATAINQQFALGTGSDAENLSKQMSDLSTSVQSNISAVCSEDVSNLTNFKLKSTNGSTIIVGCLNMDQGLNVLSKSVITNTMSTSAAVSIQQTVKQKATAEIQSFLAGFIVIILIILIIGGVIVFKGMNAFTNPKFIIVIVIAIVVLIGGYLILAKKFGWKPFKKSTTS